MLEMLSALMLKTENSSAAVMNAARGVKLAESLGDAETQMQLLITLGDARQQLGESDQAATAYGAALGIARNRNDAQHEAIILYKLGSAQLDSGDAQSAIETLEGALAMFKGQGKRDYEGRVLGALGSAYGELERWAEALNFHMSALYIAREVRDSEEESLQLSSLGYASIQAGQLGQAVLRYRQALHLAYQANNRSNIVSTLIDLARLLIRSPRHLSVTELLIDEALRYDAHDKDARQFKERITAEKTAAAADGVNFVPVNGAAQTYAANAYKLLDE
jgi:tetratricopeptide (TPR) repeat protein